MINILRDAHKAELGPARKKELGPDADVELATLPVFPSSRLPFLAIPANAPYSPLFPWRKADATALLIPHPVQEQCLRAAEYRTAVIKQIHLQRCLSTKSWLHVPRPPRILHSKWAAWADGRGNKDVCISCWPLCSLV